MFDWIANNSDLLIVLTSIGSLLIWLVYASLLYQSFKRQRRSHILINRGKGQDIDSLCIISNMSAESIFILNILAELRTSEGLVTVDVTDQETDCDPVEASLNESTRQGPLASGNYFHIGPYSDMIRKLLQRGDRSAEADQSGTEPELQRLTMRVIAVYGPENLPIGASRSFALKRKDSSYILCPESWDTQQLRSLRQRRTLRKTARQLN